MRGWLRVPPIPVPVRCRAWLPVPIAAIAPNPRIH
jgi:hypothetical protein